MRRRRGSHPIYIDDVVRLLADEGRSLKEVTALLRLRDVRFVRRIAEQPGLTPDVLEAARRRRREREREAKKVEKKTTKIEAGRRAYEAELSRKWKERGGHGRAKSGSASAR